MLEFPIVEVSPATTRTDVDQLVWDSASPTVAAPVTVSIGTTEIDIPPAAIACGLQMESDDSGRLTARVDDTSLRQALTEQLKTVETALKDATISLSGRPTRDYAAR